MGRERGRGSLMLCVQYVEARRKVEKGGCILLSVELK